MIGVSDPYRFYSELVPGTHPFEELFAGNPWHNSATALTRRASFVETPP